VLADPQERTLVSSLGWVDRGSLWIFEPDTGRERTRRLGEAQFLSLHAGAADRFAVVHHHDGERLEITAHTFAEPAKTLARCIVEGWERRLEGDTRAWSGLPRHYLAYLRQPAWSAYALVRITGDEVTLQTFDWYDDRYDKGYQGIVGVTEVPGEELVIVSVQRDSRPVLFDPAAGRKVGDIPLADRHGNPRLSFRRGARELWADDYDTLLVIEPGSWRVLRRARVQDAPGRTQQFIGHYAFDADERICAVARPFSGDVLGLDPGSLATVSRAETGGQPLDVAVLRDGRVIAREWKTGELRQAKLR